MSLVALGHHYIRDGMGVERLYDLKTDPFEHHEPDQRQIRLATTRWRSSEGCSSMC